MTRERERKKRYMQAGKPAELVDKNSEKMSTAAAAATTLGEASVDSFSWLMEGYIYIWPPSLSAK